MRKEFCCQAEEYIILWLVFDLIVQPHSKSNKSKKNFISKILIHLAVFAEYTE
jgi:hypothetical protein